jgi:hypothetical protein
MHNAKKVCALVLTVAIVCVSLDMARLFVLSQDRTLSSIDYSLRDLNHSQRATSLPNGMYAMLSALLTILDIS